MKRERRGEKKSRVMEDKGKEKCEEEGKMEIGKMNKRKGK